MSPHLANTWSQIVGNTRVGDEAVSLRLSPMRQTGGLSLGAAQAVCRLESDGTISGRWKSDIGTEGAFTARRFESKKLGPEMPKSNSVFLVHGHDEGAKHAVARFLSDLGVEPVILQEQLNRGMTVIEKFENLASKAGFAVILMTPDDAGYPTGKEEEKKYRPRQNVGLLELRYFFGKAGPKQDARFG